VKKWATGSQDHIRAVETGLGPPVVVVGQSDRRDLAEMNRLHVPAVSIAIVHDGKIEWAEGMAVYGPRSSEKPEL